MRLCLPMASPAHPLDLKIWMLMLRRDVAMVEKVACGGMRGTVYKKRPGTTVLAFGQSSVPIHLKIASIFVEGVRGRREQLLGKQSKRRE